MSRRHFEDLRMGSYCCGHVFRRERPVLLVSREGGDWQFLCGGVNHNDVHEPYHVTVAVLLDADPSLNQIADLSVDWEAERTEAGADWIRTFGAQ